MPTHLSLNLVLRGHNTSPENPEALSSASRTAHQASVSFSSPRPPLQRSFARFSCARIAETVGLAIDMLGARTDASTESAIRTTVGPSRRGVGMKPLRIAVIAFSICAAIATGARSSGKLVSWLYIGEDGKSGKVVYYPEGACDPEMPIECETMGIACEGGELRLEVTSLSPADVRRWFRDGDPTAKIVGLETVVELHAASFELSDLSGD